MANLSSVITQTVGSSSGGVNLITAPSQSSIWTATGLTLSTTTTAAELPLGGFSNTAVKFALTGSTTSAYVDFDVPTALLNTKLAVQWYARASVTTIGSITLTLQSYASSANRTSNTSPTSVTLQTSSVASAAQSFQTTFDAASQQFFRLTLSFPAASGQWYSLAQMVVGPGTVVQGAAVSDWESFTPSTSQGFGTISVTTARYRRVGSNMEVVARFDTGTTTGDQARFGLPFGFNVSIGANVHVGDWQQGSASATTRKRGRILATNGVGYVLFSSDDYTTAAGPFSSLLGNAVSGSSNAVSVQFTVPIAEWAGNGTVNLGAGAQLEYLSTPFTGLAIDRSPNGSVLPSTTPAGTSESITIGLQPWQYAPQDGENYELQVKVGTGSQPWVPVPNVYIDSLRFDGTNSIGLGFYFDQSANAWIVQRGKYRVGTATTWAALTGSLETRYRIVKAKASSPVGFGQVNSNEFGLMPPQTAQTALTFSASSPTATSIQRAVGIAYRDQSGNWRLRFNIRWNVASGTRTIAEVALTGVTFNTAAGSQALSATANGGIIAYVAYAAGGGGTIFVEHPSATTSVYVVSGDVELQSRPSWA